MSSSSYQQFPNAVFYDMAQYLKWNCILLGILVFIRVHELCGGCKGCGQKPQKVIIKGYDKKGLKEKMNFLLHEENENDNNNYSNTNTNLELHNRSRTNNNGGGQQRITPLTTTTNDESV